MNQSSETAGLSPTELSLGTLEALGALWRLRFVRTLPHSPERVWRALTDPDELAAWFPTTIDGERRAGAELTFRFRENQAPPFQGLMIACEAPRLLEFRWGPDLIRIELEPAGDGSASTTLTLYDTFDEQGKAARDAAGWHVCLDGLERTLTPGPDEPDSGDKTSWKAANAAYVRTLGPDASTIGPPDGMN